MANQTDEQLLRAFADGQRGALAALAERYERPLLNLAVAILGSPELAMDAVQETWVRVIRYAGSFNGRSSTKTWLYRVAINQCRTMLGARGAAGALTDHEEPATGDDPAPRSAGAEHRAGLGAEEVATAKADDDPARRAGASDEAEALKRAVEALWPPLREVVVLCYTQGLTHAEAAEVIGVPVGTVKSRIHAALEQLRSGMKP